MASNSFGNIFRFTTWGESHGEAIGCVVDGVPSLIELSEADIQPFLDKRKPGQNKFTTQRREGDEVKILSGVFEGKTTGTPISLIIYNEDQKSKDYGDIAEKFRPGHADYTYQMKYGIRDHRGGGRSSARETAMRVAAGAIARKIIAGAGISLTGYMVQMGDDTIDRANIDMAEIERNPFWCPDAVAAKRWEAKLDAARKDGSSLGAIIEVVAENVPVGLGDPIYDKLDAKLASAMMSINAVKAVEIGDGFAAASLRGEQNADKMRVASGEWPVASETLATGHRPPVTLLSNHAGGILGGISSGQPVVVRFAVKPTSSILTPVETISKTGENTDIVTKGRHDPCVGIRAVPVGEAMMAVVLADCL
ncbi:MAG: chorismate synthase, partial [Rickettsiales bacterium]|nr:chorismate synthase [Rickettsiales bacterium]